MGTLAAADEALDRRGAEAEVARAIARCRAARLARPLARRPAGRPPRARGRATSAPRHVARLARVEWTPTAATRRATSASPAGRSRSCPRRVDLGAAAARRRAARGSHEIAPEGKLGQQGFVARPPGASTAERDKLARLREELEALD
jgi:hypothetical protein